MGFCQSSCIDQILPLYQPMLHQILQWFSRNVVSFEIVSLRLISPFCAHWTGCSSKGALCAVNALVQPVSTYSSVPVLLIFPWCLQMFRTGSKRHMLGGLARLIDDLQLQIPAESYCIFYRSNDTRSDSMSFWSDICIFYLWFLAWWLNYLL